MRSLKQHFSDIQSKYRITVLKIKVTPFLSLSHSQVYSHFVTAGWKENKDHAGKLCWNCLEKTERGVQARAGGSACAGEPVDAVFSGTEPTCTRPL